MGIKNLEIWNKACIAKLVWNVVMKKDTLWVKWVHERYLKQAEWREYQAPPDSSWYWKKVTHVKDMFKQSPWFTGPPGRLYTVKKDMNGCWGQLHFSHGAG